MKNQFEKILKFVSSNKITFVFWFFMVLFFRAVVKNQIIHKGDSWLAGDWLINYQAGFIRRGLIGEILLGLSKYFSFPLLDSLVILKIGFYLIIFFGLVLITYRKKITITELLLFSSPWALMFEVIDYRGSGRKEIILLAAFIIFIVLDLYINTRRYPKLSHWRMIYFLVAFPLMLFIHEGLFFFYPIFYFYLFLGNKAKKNHEFSLYFLPIIITMITFVGIYFFRTGESESIRQICRSITKMKVDVSICSGAIESLKFPFPKFDLGGLFNFYLIPFILATFGTLGYAFVHSQIKEKTKLFHYYFFGFLCTLPLYIVSFDWGRWIHTYVFLYFLVIFVNREKDEEVSTFNYRKDILLNAFLLIYIFTWKLKPFVGEDRSLIRITNDVFHWVNILIK